MAVKSRAKPITRRLRPLAGGTARAAGSTARTISAVSRKAGKLQGRREARPRRGRGRLATFVAGSGAGATAGYLLDPAEGKRRRHMLRDRVAATMRSSSREAEKRARDMAGKAQGVVAEATPPGRDSSQLNDPALEAKVESELFRPPDAPKDSVNVSVQNGVVFLRGQVESKDQLESLIAEAKAIDGVSRIESLLHLPGEPAPRA